MLALIIGHCSQEVVVVVVAVVVAVVVVAVVVVAVVVAYVASAGAAPLRVISA